MLKEFWRYVRKKSFKFYNNQLYSIIHFLFLFSCCHSNRKSHRSRSRHNSDNESEVSRVSESEDRNRSNSRRRRHRSSRDSSGSESDHQSSHRRSHRRNRLVQHRSAPDHFGLCCRHYEIWCDFNSLQKAEQPRIDLWTCGFRSSMARNSRTPGSTAKPNGNCPSGSFQHSCSTATRSTGDGTQGDNERRERFNVERQRFATGSIAKRFDHSGNEFAGVLITPSPPPQAQSQTSSQAQVPMIEIMNGTIEINIQIVSFIYVHFCCFGFI